ncbi:alpha/beta hydrolase family protein [Legionella genomosp. 1]|uniref:alpha/beta hydrolase family protein n=1 Tax=Legionella genomosp. 1 TaxID=1093625 RepID=UPI001056A7EA|nr:alpha/beta hydrolase [Legionella genomosp. 1]
MSPRQWAKRMLGVILCILSFHGNASIEDTEKGQLVDHLYLGMFPQSAARLVLQKTVPLDTLEAGYDLNLYSIHYKTLDPDGRITIASGLVAMPIVADKAVSVVSYQHGTRFNREDVPSRSMEKSYMILAAFGSHGGYMTVMPDYLGLGDNELPLHPYVQPETLAGSSVDMLLAAKQLAAKLNYSLNDKLYLTGYSEGGFSTLVMFELLAKEYSHLPITAVALGSAPYDWEETIRFILLEPGPRASAYMAYFFYSLHYYKHYWTSLDDIFIPPYNTLVPELFDGKHGNEEILDALPKDPAQLLQPAFFDAILNQRDMNSENLKQLFNHYDFTPTAPLLLIGTKGDKDVPYHGSEIAYDAFRKLSDAVFIKSVSDTQDHTEAAPYVLKEQLDFFKQY